MTGMCREINCAAASNFSGSLFRACFDVSSETLRPPDHCECALTPRSNRRATACGIRTRLSSNVRPHEQPHWCRHLQNSRGTRTRRSVCTRKSLVRILRPRYESWPNGRIDTSSPRQRWSGHKGGLAELQDTSGGRGELRRHDARSCPKSDSGDEGLDLTGPGRKAAEEPACSWSMERRSAQAEGTRCRGPSQFRHATDHRVHN